MTLVAETSTVLRIGVGLLLWTSWAPPMAGQEAPSSPLSAGVGLAGVFVVGESADFLDAGWGPTAHLRLDPGGWWGFGGIVEAGWIPLEDDRGRPGQEAENTLAHLMAGPVWGVEWGRIHPYVGGVAGVVSSRWTTRQAGVEDEGADYGFLWGGLAALGVALGEGRHPVSVDLQGRILQTGVLTFGRAPVPIGPEPDVGTTEQDVVFLSLRLGVSVRF